ncbi:MAG: hypothetical protein SW833_10835 [Cyanobacteriota bacterium]|nr:hypothetical protein [Cyanobacteriota bacterium]
MNKPHSPFGLETNNQPEVQSLKPSKVSTRPSLQLPFENAAPRRVSDKLAQKAIAPPCHKIDLAQEEDNPDNSAEKYADYPPPRGERSLVYTLDEIEERLSRRLYWIQRRLVTTERKIEFQQKILLVMTLIWAILAYFAWFDRSSGANSPAPTPTEQQVVPPLDRSIPAGLRV